MKPRYATGLRVLRFIVVFEAGFIALSYLFQRALGNGPLSSEGQIVQNLVSYGLAGLLAFLLVGLPFRPATKAGR